LRRIRRILIALLTTGCDEAESPGSTGGDSGARVACDLWHAGPNLLDQRESAPTFLVEGGLVLAISGHFDNRTREPINTSELLDVNAGVSRFTGSFNAPRSTTGPGATIQLQDGRVLSGSPWNWPDQPVLPAEIWDPATGQWSVTGTQQLPGNGGRAVALPDGRVLVAGGIVWDSFNGGTDHPIARAEVWDPATGEWTRVSDMSTPRTNHVLALVEGRAMSCGGFSEYPDAPGLDTCELFDAETGTWSPAPPRGHAGAPALATLKDGRLLLAGGTEESGGNKPENRTVEIYDPRAGAWQPAAPMLEERAGHVLTLLADGRVLATGGAQASFSYSTRSAEIFDSEAGTWASAAPMKQSRRLHGAVRLPNGEVLVVGGYPGGAQFDSEIYTPCD
jgi:hypothetical protein